MIDIYYDNGIAYVWNAEDWYKLRTEHRICGNLIGSLVSHPRQNDFLGLPMALMSEEAALLLERNISELWELPNIIKMPSTFQKEESEKYQKWLLEEQTHILKKRRIEQLSQKIDIILTGKKKKLISKGVPASELNINKEVLLQEEIDKLPPLAPAHVLVHTPTAHQWETDKNKLHINNLQPSVVDGDGLCRYAVYKDLWDHGYYITNGSKFGADFLVYPGDPARFHAMYMVRCIYESSSAIRPTNLVSFGRLSVTVNKMAVLAVYNKNGKITYQTLQWHDSING